MAMSKEQYYEAGKKAAATKQPPAALRPGTWQHAAYRRGYAGVPIDASDHDLGCAQLAQGTRLLTQPSRQVGKSQYALASVVATASEHWPGAARAHALRLAEDLVQERKVPRRVRLIKALTRMVKRHGNGNPTPRQIVLQTPISTVPCPEGPVTIGDILQGR